MSETPLPLATGDSVKSARHTYQVNELLSQSSRCATFTCRNERGQTGRLKIYHGPHSVTLSLLEQTAQLNGQGIVKPLDAGTRAGCLFAVYPQLDAESANRLPRSPETLSAHIIPRLNDVTHRFHQSRLLLRDICPEHILCRGNAVAYCGLSNLVALRGGATVTGEPGYGQEEDFLSPEARKNEFSAASDYYALGVTLLKLLRIAPHSSGALSPESVQRLQDTPPALYTSEDRTLYLIHGLTLPNPKQRWGWEETRIWISGHLLPWARSGGGRLDYQFSKPFSIRGVLCWNRQQLARELARDPEAWTEQGVKKARSFIEQQGIQIDAQAESAAGTMFRCLYALNPSLDGLRWKGAYFANMDALLRRVDFPELCQMLRERCFSFLFRTRSDSAKAAQFEEMEAWEREEPGKGANRCLTLFLERCFFMDGQAFASVAELLKRYERDGTHLKNRSAALFRDGRFQAWVWAANPALDLDALKRKLDSNPEQSFFLLMSLLEALMSSEAERRNVREFYLRWGEIAPLTWLEGNLNRYRAFSHAFRNRLNKKSVLTADKSLCELGALSVQAELDYRDFVARVADNPFTLENAASELSDAMFFPLMRDGFFCCQWEGLPACPAFLHWMGAPLPMEQIDAWLTGAAESENRRLTERELQWRVVTDVSGPSGADYERDCKRNRAAALVLLAFCFGIAAVGFFLTRQWHFFAPLPLCVPFPLTAVAWYYGKRMRAGIFIRQQMEAATRTAHIAQKRAEIRPEQQRIRSELQQKLSKPQAVSTEAPDASPLAVSGALDELLLPVPYRIMAFLSMMGCAILWLMTVPPLSWQFWGATFRGEFLKELLEIIGFCGIYGCVPSFLLERRRGLFRSCSNAMLSSACVIGFLVFFYCLHIQEDFLMTGLLVPVVLAIIVAGIAVFSLFSG